MIGVSTEREMHGRKLTDFFATAARETAIRVIEDAETIRLSPEDQSLVAEALLHPPEPAGALRRAFHRRKVLLASTPEDGR